MTQQLRAAGNAPAKTIFLSGTALKKAVSMAALLAIAGTGLWAQSPPTIPPPSPPALFTPLGGKLELQQKGPLSVVKASSYRFSTDIDNYLGVTDWQKVSYEKMFIFLGGDASANIGGIQGGFATKIGANHLGLFYTGNLVQGGGYNADSGPEDVYSQGIWQNNLGILFGSEGIGGIRFDIQFNPTYTDRQVGNEKYSQGTGTTITSLQWGKSFGKLTPKVTIGFQWPEHTLADEIAGKTEWWDEAKLGLKLEIAYVDFSADYQLTVDFGETEKADSGDYTHTGYVHNDLNLYYSITGKVDEKLTVKLRPQLNFQLYGHDGKSETGGTSAEGGSLTQFIFRPILQVGAQYAFKPTVNLFAGINATLLSIDGRWAKLPASVAVGTSTGTDPSMSTVTALSALSGNLGVQLNPSKALSVELALDGLFSLTEGDWHLNFSNLGGGLAVILKPGAL